MTKCEDIIKLMLNDKRIKHKFCYMEKEFEEKRLKLCLDDDGQYSVANFSGQHKRLENMGDGA